MDCRWAVLRRRARRHLAGVTFACGAIAAVPAQGMTVAETSFPDLVQMAEQIVEGRVARIEAATDAQGLPVRRVTLAVADMLKGVPDAEYTVEMVGGRVGDVELTVPGMPQFVPGQEVIVFVAQNGKAVCPFVGATQGVFNIVSVAGVSDLVVQQHSSAGTHIMTAAPRKAAPWVDRQTSLSMFKQLIAAELSAPTTEASHGQ